MTEQFNSSFPSQQNLPQQKPTMQFLRIIEGGLFEIIFVSVCLSVLFGLLNYFNVFDLSKIYPPLAVLPKQHPTPTPSPTPLPFAYDINTVNTNLQQFVTDTLLGKYPGNISATPTETENIFRVKQTLSTNTTVEVKVINKHLSNDYDYLQLALTTTSVSATTSNATSSAATLLNTFFKPFIGTTPLSCTTNQEGQVCEQFATTVYGDVGQGLVMKPNNTYLLFRCSIPINSSMRFIKNSCLPLK